MTIMKVIAKIFVFSLILLILLANENAKKYFASPVDIPIFLSANFAEIRTNAFHAGIDIKTQGVTGKKVLASATGEVSRIRVSPVGYGRAIYINHPNGYTTVYGHLDKFSPEVESYVRDAQYKQKSFEIDLYPESGKFRFKKGELIGISGNTGSSSGPHVHFEIRKTASQVPVNPLFFDFEIKDNIAPILQHIAIYPICDYATVNNKHEKLILPLTRNNNTYGLTYGNKIEVSGKIGFGIEAFDYKNDSWNKCGIYSVEMLVNGEMIYEHYLDEMSFSDMRYINSHIDFAEKILSRKDIQKTFIEPGNKLKIYGKTQKNGILDFHSPGEHHVEIIVKDAYQNSSNLKFKVISQAIDSSKFRNPITEKFVKYMPYDQDNQFKTDQFEITISTGTLYTDLYFEYEEKDSLNGFYSKIHHAHHIYTPLHRNMRISISAEKIPAHLVAKALLVNLNGNGKPSSIGGFYEKGFITTHTNSFGRFAIMVDTLPPFIEPVNISNNKNMSNARRIELKIEDNLSGIKNYTGYINGEWALFEYDPKNKLLFYDLVNGKIDKGKEHKLDIYLMDERENINSLHMKFFY
jgi:hypothetical protein